MQREQWERALSTRADRYGLEPSAAARAAAERLRGEGLTDVLELGAGQGRDTLFLAAQGFHVDALDYAQNAVDAIEQKARQDALTGAVTVARHDVRNPLPYRDESFDACYSHMLFCMALTTAELGSLADEVLRVLRPGGLCIYTARTTDDPDYGKGIHHGDDLYESGGFIVHFFSAETVEWVARHFELVEVERFEEGSLPRDLFRVTMRRARLGGRAGREA